MNDMQRSIIQEKKIVWKGFRKIGKLQFFNEKGQKLIDELKNFTVIDKKTNLTRLLNG